MANSTAPATNNDQVADDPKKKDAVADGQDEAEGEKVEEKQPDAITTAASDAWTDVSSFISWGASKAKDAATGLASLVVPDIWGETPKPAANTTAEVVQPEAPKPEKQEKGLFGRACDWVKSGVDTVAGAVSDAWKSVFGDATIVEDKNADGTKKGFTVTEKDGDIITATKDGTVIKKGDGTTITREGGKTTVEKNGISVTRDRSGRETFKLKDGTTGILNPSDKSLSVELKSLHETVTDRGVRGELRTADGFRIGYFHGGNRRMRDLTPDEKNNDIVEAGDATRMALDKEKGVFVQRSTNPEDKTAIISRDGSNEGVEVKHVNGKVVARLVRLGADGKAIPGSESEARANGELPAWFKEYTAKRNNGRETSTVQETLQAAGIKVEGNDVTVTAANKLKLGACAPNSEGKTVCVEVPTGNGPEQKVIFNNGGGSQKTEDLANKQTTEWDGTNYSQKNDGVEQIKYNPNERHLQLFDENGNLFADSTSAGTRFSDGDYVGADGSYTDGSSGRRYFTQSAQEIQAATNQSVAALNTAEGGINSFKAALGRPGEVNIGELTSSMGSLTLALALCVKSGNFSHLAGILAKMGQCQDLIAQGVKHNADVAVRKAAVHDVKDTELAATRDATNEVAVETLRRSRMPA